MSQQKKRIIPTRSQPPFKSWKHPLQDASITALLTGAILISFPQSSHSTQTLVCQLAAQRAPEIFGRVADLAFRGAAWVARADEAITQTLSTLFRRVPKELDQFKPNKHKYQEAAKFYRDLLKEGKDLSRITPRGTEDTLAWLEVMMDNVNNGKRVKSRELAQIAESGSKTQKLYLNQLIEDVSGQLKKDGLPSPELAASWARRMAQLRSMPESFLAEAAKNGRMAAADKLTDMMIDVAVESEGPFKAMQKAGIVHSTPGPKMDLVRRAWDARVPIVNTAVVNPTFWTKYLFGPYLPRLSAVQRASILNRLSASLKQKKSLQAIKEEMRDMIGNSANFDVVWNTWRGAYTAAWKVAAMKVGWETATGLWEDDSKLKRDTELNNAGQGESLLSDEQIMQQEGQELEQFVDNWAALMGDETAEKETPEPSTPK